MDKPREKRAKQELPAAEYKCVCCGERKESRKVCSCPSCGYKMFPVPYDRKDILISEIRGFLEKLRINDIPDSDLNFYWLEQATIKGEDSDDEKFETVPKTNDDQRFPSFEKIQAFVCNASKTEQLFERLERSLGQIQANIHTPYEAEYKTDFQSLHQRMAALDTVLREALTDLGYSCAFSELTWPDMTLQYQETPDEALLVYADELLALIGELAAKIRKFIKQNNIYGTACRISPEVIIRLSDDGNYAGDLLKLKQQVSSVIAKRFTVDIFSDGSNELGEMLCCTWNAIAAILAIPLPRKSRLYYINNSEAAKEDEYKAKLTEMIGERYDSIDRDILAPAFLRDRSEAELFSLYNKMLEKDRFGFLGVDNSARIPVGESEKLLNRLIGLTVIKDSIKKIKAYAVANKDSGDLNIHMCFYGNPGTGKTEVARIIAGVLFENKILPTDQVVEVDRGGLVGQYVGETPIKTMGVIQRAMGGVLFIDEAYALIQEQDSYGHEAVATLIKAMEDYKGKFCVILAGYKSRMLQMLSSNPGFKSRIQFELDFPNYTREEIRSIAEMMAVKRNYTISESALSRILDITDYKRIDLNFANAREVRNILDQVIMCQNLRVDGAQDHELAIADVNRYLQDVKINLPTSGENKNRKILSGEEELDQLIGLASVKRMIKKVKAYSKRNVHEDEFHAHMCFYGNPGTGKTEVARILSRILYDAGVLPEAKVVETDSSGLIGRYVGETALKTHAKVQDALGGVLFVDEAYGLTQTHSNAGSGYGEEAISALLKDMEDHRGKFCAILAGYKEKIAEMLRANPGFESRIQFILEFPDYTREELGEIAWFFLKKKNYEIEEDALQRILDITDCYRMKPNFANARTVRNILDQVIMNQNLRAEGSDDDYTIILQDVEEYIEEEGILKGSDNDHMKIVF